MPNAPTKLAELKQASACAGCLDGRSPRSNSMDAQLPESGRGSMAAWRAQNQFGGDSDDPVALDLPDPRIENQGP